MFLGGILVGIRAILPFRDLLVAGLLILPFIILMQAIMIPFQLKFGGEKGRIAMIGAFGLLAILGIAIVKGTKVLFDIDLISLFNTLITFHMSVWIVKLLVFAVLCLLLSLKMSLAIMKNKEF